MDRNTPVRKPHTSTADLLTWSENPAADSRSAAAPGARSAARSHQPSDGISKVVFGGQVTDEEVESLNKRKPCSGYKLKEMTGSSIFAADAENGGLESDANLTPSNKTGLRMYQQAVAGISNISFGEVESVSPKKPTTVPEVAKQRELSGTLDSESEAKLKKQLSDAKSKELSGHNIFAPPPEIQPRPLAARALALRESIEIGEPAPRNIRTSVKVSNPAGGPSNNMFSEEPVTKTTKKIHDQKFAELTGNDIFKGDAPPSSADKSLSSAKLREINGNDIFADGKVESRDYFGGVRKPPGGSSSIALV
ncbi:DNA oxidative demethylase [Actinidia chinensis var. chinensis]|uniref:DNA oxidative demethylase n=1 Tax=Actinidia chinensis var. chinensis TaxID=1590841 RepID=A0A2R6Q0P2_ACTCC|nr:DNA oxidative demethylase [Actinidia chinensis var. chinensis]